MRRVVFIVILLALYGCAEAQVGRIGTQVPKAGGAPPPVPVPSDPTNPTPTTGVTGQATSVTLTWLGCSGATAYGVRYGTSSPPTTDSGALGSPSYLLNSLSNSTTYYWQPYCSNASGNNVGKATPTPIYSFTTTSGAAAGVLSMANLTLDGCALLYGTTTGQYTTDYPVAMYHDGSGNHRFLQVSGDQSYGGLYESIEPTLKACSTAVASLNVSTFVDGASPGIAMTLPAVQGSQQTPNNGGIIRGLYYDQTTGELWMNWSGQYTNLPNNLNNFARYSFNSTTKTLTLKGCYPLSGPMPYAGLGALRLPASWVATNVSGKPLALLGGLTASATSGNTYGPTIHALAIPADNGCAAGVDQTPLTGTALALFPVNYTGPTCSDGSTSGSHLGCTPTQAPTNPHPARMAFTGYSYDLYLSDWEPYGTPPLGYFADYTGWRHAWYDDGVKAGVIVPFSQTSGYLNTTIVSTTGPGQAVLTSLDTHDGYNVNPGDWITIQTCRIGVDQNCEINQMHQMSVVQLDTVDTGTKAITWSNGTYSTDQCYNTGGAGCNLTPIVGGAVYAGPVYPHSIPGWMRSVLRLQIIDPQQYVNVLGGAATYSPIYNEEASLYAMGVTTLGDPSAGRGVAGGFAPGAPLQQTVTSVITDETHQKIFIFVRNALNFGGSVPRTLEIRLSVSHTP